MDMFTLGEILCDAGVNFRGVPVRHKFQPGRMPGDKTCHLWFETPVPGRAAPLMRRCCLPPDLHADDQGGDV